MTAVMNPYLNFHGNAREALAFYAEALGGDANVMSFEQGNAPDIAEADKDLVMHGQIETPQGWTLMASDIPSHMDYAPGTNTFSVSLSGDDEELLTDLYGKLSEGGTIGMPLSKAPWGDSFGMFIDKFGVSWLVNISGAAS